jgi:hypothetical protein
MEIKKGKYRHFKGKEYEVLGIAHHSETLEELVVYRALYDSKEFGPDAIWVRPVSMFLDEKEIDGKRVSRFKLVEEYEK